MTLLRSNQVWVANSTYWFTEAGCFYILRSTDTYSHRSKDFAVADSLATVHCCRALEMTLRQVPKRAASP